MTKCKFRLFLFLLFGRFLLFLPTTLKQKNLPLLLVMGRGAEMNKPRFESYVVRWRDLGIVKTQRDRINPKLGDPMAVLFIIITPILG